ncbi:MAG: hypothetical protein IT349_08910 [Candidatus Eisenbacteria bacterium]|nr:hypothetical protein [Candidatus Eisenbacteria bacterium]
MTQANERRSRSDEFWEMAIAVNAAFKGLLGSQGQSGHICASTEPISIQLQLQKGWDSVVAQVAEAVAGRVRDGDVVVLAEKVVAASQGRLAPRSIILEPDPKTVAEERLAELAREWEARLGFPVTPLHLLLADEFDDDQATVGALDHNCACANLATAITQSSGKRVDVIISDTDTGIDTRRPLIATLTIAATPLGATAGLNLYEAMRCAVAAEFVRGHNRGIPVVLCVPAERRRGRASIGLPRPYPGALDASREPGLTYA